LEVDITDTGALVLGACAASLLLLADFFTLPFFFPLNIFTFFSDGLLLPPTVAGGSDLSLLGGALPWGIVR